MVSERLKLNDWSGPRVSERLALLLACSACVFTLYTYIRRGLPFEQLLGAAAALLAYMVTAFVILASGWVTARRQPLALSIAMLAFAALAAWLVAPGAMSVLMLIPALHAALLLSGKLVRAMSALAALSCWFVLNYVGDAPQTNVLLSLAEILPAAIILVVVHALSRQLARTRNQLIALSYRDELTRMLQTEHAKAAAGRGRYALLMVDILKLQSYNNASGMSREIA
jgi:hypothetical protein